MYKKYIPFLFIINFYSFVWTKIYTSKRSGRKWHSQPTVTSIYQDEFGIIWIGTKDGLNRYNGTDFHIFRPIENDKKQLVQ